ncbi:ATP-binding protein [Streptomyces sp. NPDC004134]|uniref:ATP-binding protein n=1 Tax=Streptomyces sp. NPDC004134 TaxID=3364691 RepID=UPI0036C118C1
MTRQADDTGDRSGATRSEMSGTAGAVIQARDISGGLHVHHAGPRTQDPDVPVPRQLPAAPRDFTGRATELHDLDGMLAAAEQAPALVVVTGTAGVGKTSLALAWAHRIAARFPDGQLHVNLRGYDPGRPLLPGEALHRMLTALGVPAPAIPAEPDAAGALYRSHLAGRRVLTVLDNAASAAQVRPLLSAGPGCLTLVTSRRHLGGLAVRDGAQGLTLRPLPEPDAVALLRATTAGRRAGDDASQLTELARLCARLPLALRVAAERAVSRPHLSLGDLLADLRDESSLWETLSMGDDGEDGDEDGVRAVFAWSYQALPEAEARLFRLLGLHPGPDFSLAAAAALAAGPPRATRRLLDALAGVHLLEQTAPDRFELHDLLRAYATDRAHAEMRPDERDAALGRVLTWYLLTAEAARAYVRPDGVELPLPRPGDGTAPLSFTDYDAAVDWTERERVNVHAATRAAAGARLHALAWQLPVVQWRGSIRAAPLAEWTETARLGLAASRALHDRHAEAWVLRCLGEAHRRAGRLAEAEECHRQVLVLRRELGDRKDEAAALNSLGLVLLTRRRLDAAVTHFAQALDAYRELGLPRWVAVELANLAAAHYEAGDLTPADEYAHRALAAYRDLGDELGEGSVLRTLSGIQRERGEPAAALESARRAVDIAVRRRKSTSEGLRLLALGAAQRANGLFDEALSTYDRAAAVHRRIGDGGREALAWHGTGETCRALGRAGEAAAWHRRGAARFHELGDPWHEAVALDGLAAAVRAGDPDGARGHGEAALALLAGYGDRRTAALRDGITARLGSAD